MNPDFGIEARERRFKRGQVIDLPATIETNGAIYEVDWVEVSTLDDRAIGDRVFMVGLCDRVNHGSL